MFYGLCCPLQSYISSQCCLENNNPGKTCTSNNVLGSLFDTHLTRVGSENWGQRFLFWHRQLSVGKAKPVCRGGSFTGAEGNWQRNFESSQYFLASCNLHARACMHVKKITLQMQASPFFSLVASPRAHLLIRYLFLGCTNRRKPQLHQPRGGAGLSSRNNQESTDSTAL